MNQYLTYCAQAKLLRMIANSGATSARITSFPEGSVSLEMQFTIPKGDDIMLSITPRVYTDLFTFRQMTQASIDFDYPSAEFVITRERNVIPPKSVRRQAGRNRSSLGEVRNQD